VKAASRRVPLFATALAIGALASFGLAVGCFEHHKPTPIERAETWLDTMPIDLEALAARGYGDKKRLSELLGAYWKLYRYAAPARRAEIRERLQRFVDYTHRPDYLDLAEVDDAQFKKNSMSFLRVMWLLREMDFDVTHLRAEFEKIKPRMDAHLESRGPWQKSMFARYYDLFGFEKPEAIADTSDLKGPIGERLPIDEYDVARAYQLTHQVFVAFDYGARRVQSRFDAGDLAYLGTTLPALVVKAQRKRNWDLMAELMTCMVYLRMTDHAEFAAGLEALLQAQNADGSWGDYERARPIYGEYTDAKYYLHTTAVVLETLVEHSKGNWEKSSAS
jgi:hypothetical protein